MYQEKEVKEKTLEYFNQDTLATDVWMKKYALKNKEGYDVTYKHLWDNIKHLPQPHFGIGFAAQGLTNVKAHIRGNTSWNIDGRTVTITMPGKHHNMVTEIKNVNCSRNKFTVIRDPVTGINMYGAKDAVINKGLSNAVITKQEIEMES
jgi:hypothetical protein